MIVSLDLVFLDARMLRRFGNMTTTATTERLLSSRAYVEQSSQAQRSVVSTSAQDASGGSGAKKVRIRYLNSSHVEGVEDVVLNGTTAVNTTATDIRFIQKMHVIEGSAAAGAIKLMTGINGGGSEFCGIGSYTFDAFLCHHYVPADKTVWVYGWGVTANLAINVKLMGRTSYDGNLVDEHWDLVNLNGGGDIVFDKRCFSIKAEGGSYIRLNIVPGQATSTTTRGELFIWEEDS